METSRMQGEKIDVLAERLRKSWLGAMHGRHGAMTSAVQANTVMVEKQSPPAIIWTRLDERDGQEIKTSSNGRF